MIDPKIVVRTHEAIPFDLLLLADPSMDRIKSYVGQSRMILAKDGPKIIGVLVIARLNDEKAEIMNIATVPAFQSKGIGSNLIREAIDLAKTFGYTKLYIGTADTSLNQLRLYQKLGFTVTRKIQNFFIEHYAQPIVENGKQARDMIRLEMSLT